MSGKRPFPLLLDVDDPAERGQDEEANASAEKSPAGGPDALDDGANSGEVKKHANRQQNDASGEEPANGLLGRRSHKPLSGKEAEDHGAQRGNETQSKVAALIEDERVYAREEVQEPQIEGLAEIAVLVPMGAEAGV